LIVQLRQHFFNTEAGDRIPLILSGGLHLFLLLFILFAPALQHNSPLPDVQTVMLFSAEEIAEPQHTAPPVPAKVTPKAPAAVSMQPLAPVKPAKVVSLRPLKTKKKIIPEKQQDKVRQTVIERALQQVQAKLRQQQAESAARKQIKTAFESIRQSLQTQVTDGESSSSATNTGQQQTKTAKGSGGKSSGGKIVSEARRRYYAAIIMHLSRFWSLPETQEWDETLEAVAVIWFRRDGSIIKTILEKKSSNLYFNQFVNKTLEKASPLPPIPAELNDAIIDLGIRFRPHEIF